MSGISASRCAVAVAVVAYTSPFSPVARECITRARASPSLCGAPRAQVALDHWITEALLSWTWRESKRVVEAEFDAELSRLRTALFPAIPLSEEARIEEAAARRRDARAGGAGGEGAWAAVASALERDEGAADAWHAKLDALQARVDAKPYARWTADERDELDLWLLEVRVVVRAQRRRPRR